MTSRPIIAAGIALILATGLIHAVQSPEYLSEATYIGVLFILNALGAVVAAAGIARGHRWAWGLGALVAGGAFVAFVVSRTAGLPGLDETSWEPLGIASLVIEGAFVALAARALTVAVAPAPREGVRAERPVGARATRVRV